MTIKNAKYSLSVLVLSLALAACGGQQQPSAARSTTSTAAPQSQTQNQPSNTQTPQNRVQQQAAWKTATTAQGASYLAEGVEDRIFFALNKATLSDAARGVLNTQAQWLKQNPAQRLTIEGHADERGTRDYNLALGARRANMMRDYLISQGVDGGRLQTISYGKERPVSTCAADSCWSKNRRSVSVPR